MDSIVIATNLGRLKAYRVVKTRVRGSKLDLIEDLNFLDAHLRYSDRVTDQSGRFPMSGPLVSSPQMSSYEALTAALENQKRLTKMVGDHIEEIMSREEPDIWNLAATSEIHQAILEEISPQTRKKLSRSVLADLTKTRPPELLRHFSQWGG